ncbi:hypothetical protein [Rhodopirellula sallentina]|uniref:Uncharacterized protein n=1 Tax=Rhodopirellula sallentina SM41 TaxID=1263870 RepID=M5U245_9BACT|nr:hypothetical protein [Rhodopirellula sallentina]EMI55532.1 hypothetical protein RSSM_03034 [Rhodopirellula sallentina SM41]
MAKGVWRRSVAGESFRGAGDLVNENGGGPPWLGFVLTFARCEVWLGIG